MPDRQTSVIRLAVVGLGQRAAGMLKQLCAASDAVRIDVLVDPDHEGARERIDRQGLRTAGFMATYDHVDAMLDAGPEVDAIVIGTRCQHHTHVAVAIEPLGVPVFLEKPVCISWDQYNQLHEAYTKRQAAADVVVSFPLRLTPLLQAVREQIVAGRLGVINQIQAVNNVSYGNVYVDTWYRDHAQSGGLWLQKATHDFDYIHCLIDAAPLQVTAMHSRCVWQDPVLHQDAGSAIVHYDNGVHASYSQNFITRRSAGRRGAVVTGEDATLAFDWYSGSYTFHAHDRDRVENVTIKADTGHDGGDEALAENFINVILKRERSQATLADGLLSASTCLAAREAANRNEVRPIPLPFGRTARQPSPGAIEPLD